MGPDLFAFPRATRGATVAGSLCGGGRERAAALLARRRSRMQPVCRSREKGETYSFCLFFFVLFVFRRLLIKTCDGKYKIVLFVFCPKRDEGCTTYSADEITSLFQIHRIKHTCRRLLQSLRREAHTAAAQYVVVVVVAVPKFVCRFLFAT